MAFNESNAAIMRDALFDLTGITEKRMFGGLCFLLNGNMLCGVQKDGGMARVGKGNEAAALELPGVAPLPFTGRKMGGLVEMDDAAVEDADTLAAVLELAKQFVAPMPPK